MAYSYACADCEGMEACPGKVVAETEDVNRPGFVGDSIS